MALEVNGEKRITHYSSSHKILLVGEGDFSFAACLAKTFVNAANMVATSLDSKSDLLKNYSRAFSNLLELEARGCTILHKVDARTMSQHHLLSMESFDRIIFNFPHAGFAFRPTGLFILLRGGESNSINIRGHQDLVKGFFTSSKDMVKEKGEIHVTHKTDYPYDMWNIERLAEEVGLCLVEKVEFNMSVYPGYENKRGYPNRYNETFPVGDCCTFKFAKP